MREKIIHMVTTVQNNIKYNNEIKEKNETTEKNIFKSGLFKER